MVWVSAAATRSVRPKIEWSIIEPRRSLRKNPIEHELNTKCTLTVTDFDA